MASRLGSATFACADSDRLATFWTDVLGYTREAPAVISDPRRAGLLLRFVRAPKSPTIEVAIHLDVNAADGEGEVERLLGMGAKLVETKTTAVGDFSETGTVMRDLEGNGFCVQGPDERAGRAPVRLQRHVRLRGAAAARCVLGLGARIRRATAPHRLLAKAARRRARPGGARLLRLRRAPGWHVAPPLVSAPREDAGARSSAPAGPRPDRRGGGGRAAGLPRVRGRST